MQNKYKIKDGVIFRPYGPNSSITNDNLTDAMAEMFLKKSPALLNVVIEKIENESNDVNVVVQKKKKGRKKSI